MQYEYTFVTQCLVYFEPHTTILCNKLLYYFRVTGGAMREMRLLKSAAPLFCDTQCPTSPISSPHTSPTSTGYRLRLSRTPTARPLTLAQQRVPWRSPLRLDWSTRSPLPHPLSSKLYRLSVIPQLLTVPAAPLIRTLLPPQRDPWQQTQFPFL